MEPSAFAAGVGTSPSASDESTSLAGEANKRTTLRCEIVA
jgi:hypothetical protein